MRIPPVLSGFQLVLLTDLIGCGDVSLVDELSSAFGEKDEVARGLLLRQIVVDGDKVVQPAEENAAHVAAMDFLANAGQSHFPSYSTYWRDFLEKAASGLVDLPPGVLYSIEALLFGRPMFGECFAVESSYYAWLTCDEACRLFDFVEATPWCREIFDHAGARVWRDQIRHARLDVWVCKRS